MIDQSVENASREKINVSSGGFAVCCGGRKALSVSLYLPYALPYLQSRAAAAACVSRVRHMSIEKYTILLHTRRGRILSAGEWNCDSKQSHDLVKLELYVKNGLESSVSTHLCGRCRRIFRKLGKSV